MTHHGFVRAVRRRLAERKMTAYQLHRQLLRKVSKQTVYNFVTHGEIIRTDTLATIMNALDLTVTESDTSPDAKGEV